jgi:hypothetical protein
LTSALHGGERSASRTDRFTPGEKAPCTRHWNLTLTAIEPVARHYTDWAIATLTASFSAFSPLLHTFILAFSC